MSEGLNWALRREGARETFEKTRFSIFFITFNK